MACSLPSRPRLPTSAPLEALLDADPALCDLLQSRKVQSLQDLVFLPPWELRDWLLVSEDEATAVLSRAWAACAPPMATAWDALAAQAHPRVPTPLRALNDVVGGGLSGSFLEVAGPPSAGKTQLCLHLAALTAAEGGEVFWLDTERTFAPPRVHELLESICRSRAPACGGGADPGAAALAALQRIRARVCLSLQELHTVVADLVRRAQQGDGLPALLVVDSVAALARNVGDVGGQMSVLIPQRQRALSSLASLLKVLASMPASPAAPAPPGIVVTNQVSGDPTTGGSKVTLGHVWHHAVNWRLVLSHLPPGDARGHGTKERAADGRRFLHVEKSPCSAPFTVCCTIGPGGLAEAAAPGQAQPLPLPPRTGGL
uniref:DNA repair protein RAD51-like protein 2 n=1 Tax=Lingulaulax polyedra TaxID=160621 RepID=A0A516AGG2_LINPO|nr:DNA repair protein RAD51-like protein 2 [Lingulodinium polyedra]